MTFCNLWDSDKHLFCLQWEIQFETTRSGIIIIISLVYIVVVRDSQLSEGWILRD